MSSVRFRPSTITPLLFFCARPKNTGGKSISRGCDSWCCNWHFTLEDGEEGESDTPEFQNVPPHSSLHFNSRKWIAAPPLDRSGHCSLLPIHGNSSEACCCFWAEGRRCAQLCWVERERESFEWRIVREPEEKSFQMAPEVQNTTRVSGATVTLYCTSPYLFIQPVTPLKRVGCLTECTDGAVGRKEHGGKYTSVFSEAIVFCVCTSERILEPRVASNVRTLGIKVETAASFSEQSRSCASESTASLFCKTRSYVLQ